VANYNVDIAVAIKNARALKTLNKDIKATSKIIDDTNAKLRQSANAYEANFNRLNSSVREARKNLNEAAIGTNAFRKAGEELLRAQNQLNTALKEEARILKEIETRRFGVAQSSSSNRVRRNVAESSKNRIDPKFKSLSLSGQSVPVEGKIERTLALRRDEIKLQEALLALELKSAATENAKLQIRGELNRQTATAVNNARFIGQSSPLTSAVSRGYSSPIGPMPMPPMQGPILPSAAASMRREQARAFPKERGDFGFGLAGDPIAKSIRRNKEKQFRDLLREKKANKEIRDIKARQLRLERAQNRALKERVVTTRTLAKTSQSTGGGMRGGGLFRGGARGALSNAMIGGGFPLLFGQGVLGAAGGGIGGALGGAIGGGFGFSLSIVGTAIAQRIQEAIDFRKEIEKVNVAIEKTGGTSRLTATDISFLAKNMNVTKEEALQAANAFAAFGAQSSLALAETFRDRSTFNLYANLNKDAQTFITTVDTLFQKNELGIKQAKQSLQILEERGLKEASIFAEAINNEKKIREELEAVKPTKEDVANARALTLAIFDPETLTYTKEFMMMSEEAQKATLKLTTAEGQLENRLGTLEERFQKRLELVKKNIEAQREFNESVRRALIIQAPKDELQRLLDPLLQVDALGKSIGASFSESFKGIVRGSMTAQDALRNLFNRTADHFLDMAAQILAAQIRSGIFGLFSSMFGGYSITGGKSITTASGTNIGKAGFMPSMPNFRGAKAAGGSVKGGGSYLVGERGPEMFTPGVSGMITPNEMLGGSTNIVVNVDASGSNVQGDEEQGKELGRLISVAVQSEIIQQQRPGGLLA